MDDYDRDSSSDNEHDHDEDIAMHDVGAEDYNENQDHDDDDDNEPDNDNDIDEINDNENDDDEDDDHDNNESQRQHDQQQDQDHEEGQPQLNNPSSRQSSSAGQSTLRQRLAIRPEALTAKTYDIVPTMAAPMATSVNAIAITPDLRYWMTGGSDGYIRKYDGPATINGKTLLTVAQRHPFVDSVTKAGVLMSYWENAEPQSSTARQEDLLLSPVYSLAVHSQALWLLSGLESGGINLQSVRHDEGKRITCLQRHTNAVSVLTLAPDEKSVLSGSWDKNIFDWDLNTGNISRQFDGNGGQISAIELRPANGAPVPPEASEELLPSDTFSSNTDFRATTHATNFNDEIGFGVNGVNGTGVGGHPGPTGGIAHDTAGAQDSPAHDSLFGGSPGGGSDLFGDNDGMGAFGGDDDNEFSRAMMRDSAQDNMPIGDYSMPEASFNSGNDVASTVAPSSEPQHNGIEAPIEPADPMIYSNDTTNDFGLASTLATQPEVPMANNPTSIEPPPATQTESSSTGHEGAVPQSPSAVFAAPPPTHNDNAQALGNTFLSASMDGTIRIWDRRVQKPVARIGNRPGVPPWCMGACWSPDGNWIYAGRRNGTVEEFNIQKARGGRQGWQPERVLKFPGGSGPVSCVRPMPNGRHIVCASHDILRLWDLQSESGSSKHSPPPFLIVPGPPRAGVISHLYIDASCRFMLSAAGNRGWEGVTTEVLIGYEINTPN
ncbi:WD40-repeat-containing domain protein [Xylaria sp. CBS 124048]|nr:WD40-repeat-containing domain protein [Xylaria sp. CBS 124048]